MDQTQLQDKIAEYYKKLTPNMQGVFERMEWMQAVQDIGFTYKLTQEQIAILATETTLALLGIIHPDEYRNVIIDNLKADADTQQKILNDIYEKVFKPIAPDLTEAYITNVQDIIKEDSDDIPLPPPTTNKEIPIPVPVQKTEKTTAPISNSQNGIFEKAGIEMVEDEGAHLTIVENKLNKPTVKMQSVKDYSLPKLSREKPNDDHTKPSSDPYHEAI